MATTSVQTRSVTETDASSARAAKRGLQGTRNLFLALVAPSALLLLIVNAYPVFYAAQQSLRDGNLLNAGEFVGLFNYVKVLTSNTFWKATGFTLIFTLVAWGQVRDDLEGD